MVGWHHGYIWYKGHCTLHLLKVEIMIKHAASLHDKAYDTEHVQSLSMLV